MGIFYNDENACIPCRQVIPVSEPVCRDIPVMPCNDPYVYGHCRGSHYYKYIDHIDWHYDRCGRVNDGATVKFDFIGNRYKLQIRKNTVTIDTNCGYICLPSKEGYGVLSIDNIFRLGFHHKAGYVDACGCGHNEVLTITFYQWGYAYDIKYNVILCIDSIHKCITLRLMKNDREQWRQIQSF